MTAKFCNHKNYNVLLLLGQIWINYLKKKNAKHFVFNVNNKR